MKHSVGIILAISCISVLLFALLIYKFTVDIIPKDISEEAAAGKQVWEDKGCIECHAVLGNGGYSAPELTKVYSERGADWLLSLLQDPPLLPPAKKERHPRLPAEDSRKVVEYLRLISEIKLLDWPPQPFAAPGERVP